MRKWISLLGIICLSLFFMVGVEAQPQDKQDEEGSMQVQEAKIEDKFIQGTYPEIVEANNLSAKVKINEQIDKALDDLKVQLKMRNDDGEKVTGELSYTIKTNNDKFFSVELDCTTKNKDNVDSSYVYSLNFDSKGNLIDFAQIVQSSKVSKDDERTINKIEQANAQLWQQMDRNIEDMKNLMRADMRAISAGFWGDDNSLQSLLQDELLK